VRRGVDEYDIDEINIILDYGARSVGNVVPAPRPNNLKTYNIPFPAGISVCPIEARVAPSFKVGRLEEEGEVTSEVNIPKGEITNPSEISPPITTPFIDYCGPSSFCALVLDSVGYWPLNGDMDDLTGRHNGSGSGTSFVSGHDGQGVNFSTFANDSSINTGSWSVSPGDQLTIAAWFKINNVDDIGFSPNRIVSKGRGSALEDNSWMFGVWSNGPNYGYQFRLSFNSSPGADAYQLFWDNSSEIANGVWVFAAATYDGAIAKIYEGRSGNVVEVNNSGSVISGYLYQPVTDEVWIGSQPGETAEFEGVLDDIIVFERALNISELQIIHNGNV
jgi:hypothetical protein